MHRTDRKASLIAVVMASAVLAVLAGCAAAAPSPTLTSTAAPTAQPTATPQATPTPAPPEGPHALILTGDERRIVIRLEVATTPEEKAVGLSKRSSLAEDAGMIFLYPSDHHGAFWMKDTWISLSIAFIAADGRIQEIQHMEPNTTDTHQPVQMYRYALEVNRGFFENNGVNVGDRVDLRLGGKQ